MTPHEVSEMTPVFEVWQSPGGKVWAGTDQEEAILAGLRLRRPGVLTEVAEVVDLNGQVRPRRIASCDDRQSAKRLA